MSFYHLRIATSISNKDTRYFTLVIQSEVKRSVLHIQLLDFLDLIAAYKEHNQWPIPMMQGFPSAEPVLSLSKGSGQALSSANSPADSALDACNRAKAGDVSVPFGRACPEFVEGLRAGFGSPLC